MLLVSSYSHPASVLAHAAACGYRVVDFLVTPLPFGTYSSQPKVGIRDVPGGDGYEGREVDIHVCHVAT